MAVFLLAVHHHSFQIERNPETRLLTTGTIPIRLKGNSAPNEPHPTTPAERFFAHVKNATLAGYYTFPEGLLKELNYQGNSGLAEFPGCSVSSLRERHGSENPCGSLGKALSWLERRSQTG